MIPDSDGWPDLSAIVRLAPPPADPVGGLGDWTAVESELGTALPSDFKTLANAYGHGQFQDFLSLLVPTGHRSGPAEVARGAGSDVDAADDYDFTDDR